DSRYAFRHDRAPEVRGPEKAAGPARCSPCFYSNNKLKTERCSDNMSELSPELKVPGNQLVAWIARLCAPWLLPPPAVIDDTSEDAFTHLHAQVEAMQDLRVWRAARRHSEPSG